MDIEIMRPPVTELEDFFRKRRERRQRRKKMFGIALVIIIGLILWLMLKTCETPSTEVFDGKIPSEVMKRDHGKSVNRDGMGDFTLERAAWSRYLSQEINKKNRIVSLCLEKYQIATITWHFEFNPQRGETMNHRYHDQNNVLLEKDLPDCLSQTLEGQYRLPKAVIKNLPDQWYEVSIQLRAPSYSED